MAQKIPSDLDSIANAKATRVPAIFLLAENDEVIAPKYQRLVVEAYAGEKRLVPLAGARHNDPLDGVSIAKFVEAVDWLLPRQPE
jgi:hypothetical protein